MWFSGKESSCHAGDPDLIPRSGISFGEGNGNPLRYSCQENSTDGGAWRATVHGVTKSMGMTKQLTLRNRRRGKAFVHRRAPQGPVWFH